MYVREFVPFSVVSMSSPSSVFLTVFVVAVVQELDAGVVDVIIDSLPFIEYVEVLVTAKLDISENFETHLDEKIHRRLSSI